MIKEKDQLLRRILMLFDILVALFSFFAAFKFRDILGGLYKLDLFPEKHVLGNLKSISDYMGVIPVFLFAWWLALSFFGLYNSFRKKSFFEIVLGIIKSTFLVMVVFSTIAFIFKLHFISRSLMMSAFFTAGLFLIVERWVIVYFLRSLRKKGYNYRNVLLVGTGPRAENFIKLVHRHSEWGLKIVGLVDAEKDKLDMTISGEKVIGLLEDLPKILTEKVIDEVVFIVPRKWLAMIEESLLACEIRGIKANIATDFFNMKIANWAHSDIDGIPILGFKTTVGEEWQLLFKRLFDIIISLIAMLIALPVFIILVLVIKKLYPGHAIFRQQRSGLNGREFTMYKFRTMVNGAEEQRAKLDVLNEMDGPAFKMRNDPRVTKFGGFLRRTSLDELPQLFNVLKGEMSLVGPRPPIPSEVAKYEVWQRRRLSLKPGLTCLWQVNGRNNVDFDKWMKMDLEYIDNWSISLDFKILLKTVPAVLFSIGAR